MTMLAQFAATGGGAPATYIEDVFSTYLFTGTGGTVTVNNGLDMTKGGLYWIKQRSDIGAHWLWDSARGATKSLATDDTAAQAEWGANGPVFNNGSITDRFGWGSGYTQATWTFRKQPKFFDVVTYTGNGVAGRTVAHSLESTPGFIIVKRVNATGNWRCYHRSVGATQYVTLNSTDPAITSSTMWNDTAPTSTVFTVGSNSETNLNGGQYVAYLFAHDAGGFGLSGSENVVSCGSFTVDASGNATVNLGYEPQYILAKKTNATGPWIIEDTMRGMSNTSSAKLIANTSGAETVDTDDVIPDSTGFRIVSYGTSFSPSSDYIYIAIRRGPMKVPTDGTTVYNAITRTGTGAVAQVTGVGFPPDLVASGFRNFGGPATFFDRLRGPLKYITSSATDAETTPGGSLTSFNQDGFSLGADPNNLINFNTGTFVDWNFLRAPSFFDEVCYTGTGSTQTQAHNLGAIPELMIFKQRTGTARSWGVYVAALGNANQLLLNSDSNVGAATTLLNSTSPTASIFTVGSSVLSNQNGSAIVAYLFATCAGVSKVGSYTGTGTSQVINCGFTAGARFVLIKRTDSTGDWYVWDSARGIIAGNDPYLLLNSTAVEVTSTDYVDASATGFELTSTAPAAINASGGSFIFLAIS